MGKDAGRSSADEVVDDVEACDQSSSKPLDVDAVEIPQLAWGVSSGEPSQG